MNIHRFLLATALTLLGLSSLKAGENKISPDSLLPVRGLCIAAPDHNGVDAFGKFIADELVPLHLNTLILRVDYGYHYSSHPELADEEGLTKEDVKKLVSVCKKGNIRLIPQLNLLGHQSWAGKVNKLLQVYPQLDETPWVQMPEKYVWPNDDGLYCKSYCPLHPEVHAIVFDLVDEICDAFESDAFHAGMDEVFYIGEEKCPRCGGRDPSELFAGEVSLIHDHLAMKNRELWIWGDRLIDGKTTGIGMWEASFNNTWRAIDRIPKDVMICDWHYERPDPTPVYFAAKGFRVVACPWRDPEPAVAQVQDMVRFRQNATREMQARYCGVLQTVWSDADSFIRDFNLKKKEREKNNAVDCFLQVFDQIDKELQQH